MCQILLYIPSRLFAWKKKIPKHLLFQFLVMCGYRGAFAKINKSYLSGTSLINM